MGMLCAVTFTSNGQLHYADPGELRPEVGDMVLLPTEHGSVAARVVWAAEYSPEETEGFPVLIGHGRRELTSPPPSRCARPRPAPWWPAGS